MRIYMQKNMLIINNIDGENFHDILKDYISKNLVEIIDIRGFSSSQIGASNYCYYKYNYKCDWLGFFDMDEYLYINLHLNINTYLYNSRFKKCQSIIFNWYVYDDNNLEKYDNRTLLERFKNIKSKEKTSKSIVRGSLNNLLIPSVHILAINVNYFCDSNGNRIFPKSFLNFDYKNNNIAYIKHFYTKTAEEFCYKINRGDAQFKNNTFYYRIKKFFSINNITKEKIKIIEKCSKVNLNKLLKK